jgi:diguanylate cyclase (GGDEF)-like protein/PAS domain S-box-containing protein
LRNKAVTSYFDYFKVCNMDLIFRLNPVALTLLIPGFISAVLALYTFSIRNVVGSRVFALVMLAVSLWSLTYAAELASLNLSSMLFITTFEYLGIACVPVLWLILTFLYTGRHQWIRARYIGYLFIIPFITIILVSTNQFHNFYYSSVNLNTSGPFPQLATTRGIWYWVNSGYSYVAVLLSIGLLLEKLRHPHSAYRPQVLAMLIGVSVPWIVNIFYLAFRLTLFGNVDITPFAFAVSGLVIAWGIFRYRLFSIIPAARENVIESMKEGVIVVDSENKLGDINTAARQIFGWKDSDVGRPINSILQDWPEMGTQFQSNENSRQEIIHGENADQHHFEVTVSTIFARGDRRLGRLTIVRDITEWKTLAQKLEQMATHDPLTGLPGRLLLTDRVDMAIARAKRKNSKLAVMMCDLDRFKNINDTLGHGVGDSVLRAVSSRLNEPLRKNDTTARLGGDEFVILLPEIADIEEAVGAARRLLILFQNPLSVDGYLLQITFSLGIAIFPEDGDNLPELLKKADVALYLAKKNGRNRFELFKPLEKTLSSTKIG